MVAQVPLNGDTSDMMVAALVALVILTKLNGHSLLGRQAEVL